jgi:predicted O-methyltransferase YrrM
MAEAARSVVTVEQDPERAAIAAERLRPFSNVELVVGTWQDLLPVRGPFGLLFHDAGDFKRSPDEYGDLVLRMLEPGGLLVMDDMTPGRQERDPIREWVRGQPGLLATEVLTSPQASALVIARL